MFYDRTVSDERLLYAETRWTHAAVTGSVSGKCPSHCAAICALEENGQENNGILGVRHSQRERERERERERARKREREREREIHSRLLDYF